MSISLVNKSVTILLSLNFTRRSKKEIYDLETSCVKQSLKCEIKPFSSPSEWGHTIEQSSIYILDRLGVVEDKYQHTCPQNPPCRHTRQWQTKGCFCTYSGASDLYKKPAIESEVISFENQFQYLHNGPIAGFWIAQSGPI